ncbi:hypothetical protein RUND412_008337 [Rhizina undulata]
MLLSFDSSTDSEEELPDFTFVSGSPEKSYVPQRQKKTLPKAKVPPWEDPPSHPEPPLAEYFYISDDVSGDSDDSFEIHFMLPPELSRTHLSADPQEEEPKKDTPQSSPPPDYSPSPGLSQNEHFHSHSEKGPQTPPRVQIDEESPQPPPRGRGMDPNVYIRTKVSRTPPPDLSMIKILSDSLQEFLGVHGTVMMKKKFGPSIEVGGLLPEEQGGEEGEGRGQEEEGGEEGEGWDQKEEGGEEGEGGVEMEWQRALGSGVSSVPPNSDDDEIAMSEDTVAFIESLAAYLQAGNGSGVFSSEVVRPSLASNLNADSTIASSPFKSTIYTRAPSESSRSSSPPIRSDGKRTLAMLPEELVGAQAVANGAQPKTTKQV